MKYWRGYLVAAIIALCTWALGRFCAAHTQLVDMVYPYVDRIVMDYLANWSSNFAGCLWQTILIFLAVLFVASIVLMIVLRWNPVQWFGWVLCVVSLFGFLNTGVYGLNQYTGSIADDVRLNVNEYSLGSLERAAIYYGQKASEYSSKVSRKDGNVETADFDKLNKQAGEGFEVLTYEKTLAIFSGTTVPVKELGRLSRYEGVTGVTVGLTGESAVNPNVPDVGMPFAICHEMMHRMCTYHDSDADFGAFLSCTNNSSNEFQYSGYLMAFRGCYNALVADGTELGQDALDRVLTHVDSKVLQDMAHYNSFFGEEMPEADTEFANLLVSWHIQEIAQYDEDDEHFFDPMDETDERFKDILEPYQTEAA